ncbi:hypothetical protein [Deinococcus ruber]|uniref:Uncharacterized protein n=1 Tax=Deinococcus ruber TaxID=1848197 RepID=A0A918CEI7_9DEIO|nr:hypothetical protein [Deinococcus ruber]GGR17201.1 hypothetical protein GCM10008957_32270 [Deinococcus ruber]
MNPKPLLVVCHSKFEHSFVSTPNQTFYDKSDRWEVMAALHLGNGGRVIVLRYPHKLEDGDTLLDWIDEIQDGSKVYSDISGMEFEREITRPGDWDL